MNKMREQLQKKKKNNKGFSLVELIIVIAIMAILVGIVGTQVIPYLNRSREAKDLQIINSYSTAAVSAYSINAESVTTTTLKITMDDDLTSSINANNVIANEIKELVGYNTVAEAAANMSSTDGQEIDSIVIEYDFDAHTVKTQAYDGTTPVFDPVEATL